MSLRDDKSRIENESKPTNVVPNSIHMLAGEHLQMPDIKKHGRPRQFKHTCLVACKGAFTGALFLCAKNFFVNFSLF